MENNTFQLFEYSLSRNLSQNALQIQFGVATNVLPNVFVVELPDRQQICLMFVTHIGVYRWIISHPTINSVGQLVNSIRSLNINCNFLFSRINLNRFLGQSTMIFYQIEVISIDMIYNYTIKSHVRIQMII